MTGSGLRRPERNDTGAATTTTVVMLTPVLTLVLFAAFQAGLWNHARTEARAVAHQTATLVARQGADPIDARQDALAGLAANSDLDRPSVDVAVDRATRQVTVRVEGRAPGIVIGTSTSVAVQVVLPLEGWVAL